MVLAAEKVLPLSRDLHDVLTLRRGSTVVIASATPATQGATTLALAVLAAASETGSWCAALAMPDLGLVAASEAGVALDRLALVPDIATKDWVTVAGALLDAVDVLVARPPRHLRLGDTRRLTARARERGTILIPVTQGPSPWSEGAEARLTVTGSVWANTTAGEGHLLERCIDVLAIGRGAASRERRIQLHLPIVEAPRHAGSDAHLIPDPEPVLLEDAG